MKKPMIVQIPGSKLRASVTCSGVPINISGEIFPADLIVLGTEGIDVILGMNWLSKHRGRLDCTLRTVNLTSPKGVQVEYTDKPDKNRAYCQQIVLVPSLDEVNVVFE